MNKELLKKAMELSVSSDRLNNNREQYPVEWLLREQHACWGYKSKLEMIRNSILEMDKRGQNYQMATDEDKVKIEKLIENREVVDIVIVTIFQWFGSNVGRSDIGRLMDDLRKTKYRSCNTCDDREVCQGDEDGAFPCQEETEACTHCGVPVLISKGVRKALSGAMFCIKCSDSGKMLL